MKKNQIIEFEPRERILEKARKYVDSLELFSQGSDRAIPLLLKAIKYADKDLKSKIIIFLGTFAKDEAPRIRKLALKRLDEEAGSCLLELKEEIETLINDPNMEVKKGALEILKKNK